MTRGTRPCCWSVRKAKWSTSPKVRLPGPSIRVLEDKSELNAQNLANLEKETGAGRVIIEYNGMWLLQDWPTPCLPTG